MSMSISKITGDLAAGKTTARQHLETCLEAIDSKDGRRAFITVNTTYELRQERSSRQSSYAYLATISLILVGALTLSQFYS